MMIGTLSRCAAAGAQIAPVAVGQADIQDHGVEARVAGASTLGFRLARRVAASAAVNSPSTANCSDQRRAQRAIVIDDQDGPFARHQPSPYSQHRPTPQRRSFTIGHHRNSW